MALLFALYAAPAILPCRFHIPLRHLIPLLVHGACALRPLGRAKVKNQNIKQESAWPSDIYYPARSTSECGMVKIKVWEGMKV